MLGVFGAIVATGRLPHAELRKRRDHRSQRLPNSA
jgi:hypothetical protein